MKLLNVLKKFGRDDSGAVTVDWVVLTAAIVGIAIVVVANLQGPLEDAAEAIGVEITKQSNYANTDGDG